MSIQLAIVWYLEPMIIYQYSNGIKNTDFELIVEIFPYAHILISENKLIFTSTQMNSDLKAY